MSQELYNNVLDLVKQNGLYPYQYITDFEKYKEELPSKERFAVPYQQKINYKEYEQALNV